MPNSEQNTYLLLDWTSHYGGIWREMSEADANEAAIVQWIIDGQFSHPMKVVAFNTAKEWSRDVTQEIALRLLKLNQEGVALGAAAKEFVERITGQSVTAIV